MMKKSIFLNLLVVIFAVIADQIVKYWVETGMDYHQQIGILPFLALFRTHNDGIAFSMLSSMGGAGLIVMTLIVIGFVLYLWWTSSPERRIARFGFALIIGGALGNLIDRSLHGYVIDYVLFHTATWSFAVFNLADAFITIGAGLIILDELIAWRSERGEGKVNDQ
ncbi:signal peptidase II [Phyllobacterium phragmitis]|uniref:Lipoprotein signal peptidase n=1 Tax=Phyllobacterium phragmitis TaxID=2670329 RepID=A0A2S9IS82_9HYPH|nr:signal peptidase II [Phyllobacterium phragmitis]PRD43369.1 signal peptidase II [Phyllobacterium phragmitis]